MISTSYLRIKTKFGFLTVAGIFTALILLLSLPSFSHGAKPGNGQTLKIALVHFEVKYKEAEENRRNLIDLNRRAAEAGAKLILNTEMAVSGYSFLSRRDIAPFTETDQGRTVQAMGQLAKEHGAYIGIAFPEKEPATQCYYNSAFVLGPDGSLICKYRKIATEKRWARPGSPLQKGVFDTPWGRMGVLICADSYYPLMSRTMALKGVNFLWVPANWPPTGGLDPKFIWRARALENGFFLAACNRTGMDRILDCRQTASYVFNPQGRQLFSGSSEKTQIFFVEIPLDENGRLPDVHRQKMMQTRKIDYYRPVYLEPWTENLTSFYELPEPGDLDIHCLLPSSDRFDPSELEKRIEETPAGSPALWVLPETPAEELNMEELAKIAKDRHLAFAVAVESSEGHATPTLVTPEGIQSFVNAEAAEENAFPFDVLRYGPAAVAMVDADDFQHPELAEVLSKLGADLVVLSETNMTPESLLVSRIKSLAGIAVAACAENAAEITSVKDMHGSWDLQQCSRPGVCTYRLDTSKTRKKLFQSRIDFDTLLKSE